MTVGTVPRFATHYHLPDRAPFLNLSELGEDELASVLAGLESVASTRRSARRFGPRYMALRRATEHVLRDRFIAAGGKPVRYSPHYFVLGESEWFRGLYGHAGEIRIALGDLPAEATSCTYPDSVTSMGLLEHFGFPTFPQPYHGQVFRLEELAAVIDRYGLPGTPRPDTYEGHQRQSFEHYIEIQLWTDDPLRR
jgi:hypothetical protein